MVKAHCVQPTICHKLRKDISSSETTLRFVRREGHAPGIDESGQLLAEIWDISFVNTCAVNRNFGRVFGAGILINAVIRLQRGVCPVF